MLTTTSDAQALIARLDTVAPAVKAALAAYLRSRQSGVAKRQAISAYAERLRPESLAPPGRGRGPRRKAAWEGEGCSGQPRRSPSSDPRRNPSPYPLPGGERYLKQAAVQAALQALGRSS